MNTINTILTWKWRYQTGFTLIEVMVALAIIAIALSAVTQSLGVTVSNQSHLQSRVVATWVAQNAIVAEQLALNKEANAGEQRQFGRDWEVNFAKEATFIPEIYRFEVEVRALGEEAVQARLHSVVGPD